ncbi:hypothetical protein COY95_00805 [Candidatus Woesearchaeota archaeon CG_4_10_14_0_8_um_filter_47_5]|nr:MAG: hypothetical protein COY95_00805 [Candidatus Woesearchaeota archaeon CG_4_10_14_0_8_um_filter_47_5]
MLTLIFCDCFYAYHAQVHHTDALLENRTAHGLINTLQNYFINQDEYVKETVFSQEEVLHYRDVKHLIRQLIFLWAALLLSAAFLIKKCLFPSPTPKEAQGAQKKIHEHDTERGIILRNAGILHLGSGILFILLALNFSRSFTGFHSLFFREGSWMFPAESYSIRLFPPSFFKGIFSVFVAVNVISAFLLLLGSALLLRRGSAKKKRK